MPSCWRAAAPGLWLVRSSIHFMFLWRLICFPCAKQCCPRIQLGRNRGAGQKTRSRVTGRPQYTNRLLSASLPTGNTCSLACFRSDLLLSEVSPSSSCGEKPKRKKKKSCSIVSLLSDKLPDHWSKTFGGFDLVCYLLSLVCCFGVCCFSEGSKRTCIWWDCRCRTRACGCGGKAGEAGSRLVEKEGGGWSFPGVGTGSLGPLWPGLGHRRSRRPH